MDLPEPLWIILAVTLPFLCGVGLVVTDLTRRGALRNGVARGVACAASLLTGGALAVAVISDAEVDVEWIAALNVRFHLGIDDVSVPLVFTAAAAVFVACAIGRPVRQSRFPAAYHGLILIIGALGLTALLARDAVLLALALQAVVVALWFLARAASVEPAPDSTRFLLLAVAGSTLVLGGVLTLSGSAGTGDLDAWASPGVIGTGNQTTVAALILVGLATLIPLWPLHTWAPAVHAHASAGSSVLIAGVLATAAVHAVIRLVVAPLPHGLATVAPVLAAAAAIGVVWAGLAALVERDLARIVGWISIAHLSLIMLAISSGSATGLQVAILGTVAHAAVVVLLVVLVGDLREQWGSTDLATARAALREAAPRLGFAFVAAVAAATAVPGLAGFWTQVGSISAAWSPGPDRTEGWFRLFAVLAVVGLVVLGAVAARLMRDVWSGDRTRPEVVDLRVRGPHTMALLVPTVGVLLLVVVAIGVYPVAILDFTADAVDAIVGVLP